LELVVRILVALGKRGLKPLMPDECYKDPNYEFQYEEDK